MTYEMSLTIEWALGQPMRFQPSMAQIDAACSQGLLKWRGSALFVTDLGRRLFSENRWN